MGTYCSRVLTAHMVPGLIHSCNTHCGVHDSFTYEDHVCSCPLYQLRVSATGPAHVVCLRAMSLCEMDAASLSALRSQAAIKTCPAHTEDH